MPDEIVLFGVDAVGSPSALATGDVQTATNIDFAYTDRAAMCRRGSVQYWNGVYGTATASAAVTQVFRNLNNPFSIDASPTYVVQGTAVYRGTSGTYTQLFTGGSPTNTGFGNYYRHTFIASGAVNRKDDGTNVTEWIMQSPGSAPNTAVSTLAPLTVTSTWTALEGTGGGTMTGTATGTTDKTTGRVTFAGINVTADLTSNSGHVVGTGPSIVDQLWISFSNPSAVTRVSRDYPIHDFSFNNYYHTEIDLSQLSSLPENVTLQALAQAGQNRTSPDPVSNYNIIQRTQGVPRSQNPVRVLSAAASQASFVPWSVPRANFIANFNDPTNSGWKDIAGIRITVECNDLCVVTLKSSQVSGADDYPILDTNAGVMYWETWAHIENGAVTNESGPSSGSTPLIVNGARVVVTSTATATSTINDITHRIWYRQGGLLPDIVAVGTTSYGTATFTDSTGDTTLLAEEAEVLVRNIYSQSTFPTSVTAISEPFKSRIFIGFGNQLGWSTPGNPSRFPIDSETDVSHTGDNIQGIVIWDRIVIVNRDTVYEMDGNIFEGTAPDWVLQRSGSRRGAKAPNTVIKTPHGIPLLDYDGISMYLPGRGIDTPVDWAMAKLADAFKGAGAFDPAGVKGSRVPAINKSYINVSVAAYADDKLYLGTPTGTSSLCNTVYVLDFAKQRVYWYNYGVTFGALVWDPVDNRMLMGLTNGTLLRIETGVYDILDGTAQTGVAWNVKTRAWSSPDDKLFENLAVDVVGTGTVSAIFDSTNTASLGTFAQATRGWFQPSLAGVVGRQLEIAANGNNAGGTAVGVFGMRWNAITQPQEVTYYRSLEDYSSTQQQNFTKGASAGEKIWDQVMIDVEVVGTGTVSVVTFLDNVPAMTNTIVGPTGGRVAKPFAFPTESYGSIAYTTMTGPVFKPWNIGFNARPEPSRVVSYVSDRTSEQESIWDTLEVDINPLSATVLGTMIIDGTTISTATLTGNHRQSIVTALPAETYGRTGYVIYNGTGVFKHYNTWYNRRKEPERVTNFVTDKVNGPENRWLASESDVNPLGGTVLGTVYVDGTAITTATLTGSTRQSVPTTLPGEVYGRSFWVVYTSSTPFKHYATIPTGFNEPDRLTDVDTDKESGDESIWDALNCDLNCFGTAVVGTMILDNSALMTFTATGSGRQSYIFTCPGDTYGRTAYALFTSANKFKHYRTWYTRRAEPGRLGTFVANRESVEENILDDVETDINCFGTAVTGVTTLDGTAIATFTLTGSGRESYVSTLPAETYGRTVYTKYTSAGLFKHYNTWYHKRPEPGRVGTFVTDRESVSEAILDSVEVDINPINTPVVGITTLDGTAISTFTITGNGRQSYIFALPAETYGRTVSTKYASNSLFKHYRTWYNKRPEPGRINNYVTDRESVEETILDDVETDINCLGTAVTGTVVLDGTALQTFTLTGTSRQSYVTACPAETYGRTVYVKYNSAALFKHYHTWFHKRPEPGRILNYVTDRVSEQECIWDTVEVDMNALGSNVLGTFVLDGTAITTFTFTSTKRQSVPFTLPVDTYGRTAYVAYNGTTVFKHYNTWFHKRPEPDRITSFMTDRKVSNEQWYKVTNCDINPLGGSVVQITYVDSTAVATATLTGAARRQFSTALPDETYGDEIHAKYTISTGYFKHYDTYYETEPEPNRLLFAASQVFAPPVEVYPKTLLAEVNPLGGIVTAVAYAEVPYGTATETYTYTAISTATLTGTRRHVYELSMPLLNIAKSYKATYTSPAVFKHYSTQFVVEPRPYNQTLWSVSYKKIGGASQIDIPRFYQLDLESQVPVAVVAVWSVDGTAVSTDTLNQPAGRNYYDRIKFPPIGRGYLFQLTLSGGSPFQVWSSTLDTIQLGPKGVTRRAVLTGVPQRL